MATSKKVFGKPTGEKSAKRKENQKPIPIQNGSGKKPKASKHQQSNGKPKPKELNGHDESEMNEEDINDLLEMIEDEDDELLNGHSTKKRKRDGPDDDDAHQFEQEYAHTRNEEKSIKMRTVDLLPIKTKTGELITRTTEVEIKERLKEMDEDAEGDSDEEEEEVIDSDDDIINDVQNDQNGLIASSNKISTTDLLILREQEINRQKYRIGIICSGILEKPDDKMKNFNALFELMDEKVNGAANLFSVRKIATMSILEVFKDIIPEYRIGQIDLKTQKGKYHKCVK